MMLSHLDKSTVSDLVAFVGESDVNGAWTKKATGMGPEIEHAVAKVRFLERRDFDTWERKSTLTPEKETHSHMESFLTVDRKIQLSDCYRREVIKIDADDGEIEFDYTGHDGTKKRGKLSKNSTHIQAFRIRAGDPTSDDESSTCTSFGDGCVQYKRKTKTIRLDKRGLQETENRHKTQYIRLDDSSTYTSE